MDQLFTPPVDRWDAALTGRLTGRDEVLHRSHLVGSDPALTKEGGGNFSAKGVAEDHRGRPVRVLYMSAWGCDGAATTPEDFPALRLDDLLVLRDADPPGERGMTDYAADCGLRAGQRAPGIETLTHAFIPAAHVDHCHPDAVIALTSFPGGRAAAEAEFGDEAIWFDYRQFDLGVARELAGRITALPRCRFVLLANHGLFTWAETSEACYRNSLEAVRRAGAAVERAIGRAPDLGGPAVPTLDPEAAGDLLAEILPPLRGALSAGTPGLVLHVDRGPAAARFASSARGPRWTQDGPSCPDHLVTVGYRPLVMDRTPSGAHEVLAGVERHRAWYARYYDSHVPRAARELGMRSDAPRAILLPGLGALTCGADAAKARLCADHLAQTMTVVRAADAAGGYVSLSEAQGAADEYWPLMRLKPQLRAPEGTLAGKIFLVAADDAARAGEVGAALARAGAHVALAARQDTHLADQARSIVRRYGERRAIALPAPQGARTPATQGRASATRDQAPVTRDWAEAAVRAAVLAYGGFDALVDMTRTGGLARAALPVLTRQGMGGTILLAHDGWPPGALEAEVRALETARDALESTRDAVEGAGDALETVGDARVGDVRETAPDAREITGGAREAGGSARGVVVNAAMTARPEAVAGAAAYLAGGAPWTGTILRPPGARPPGHDLRPPGHDLNDILTRSSR
ncbi:class II aldolase/adducin family protein [Nonomuraea sp. NPDC059023]|uniref:class II aldolase/adducin family protein n=1 Tax=unclassified Nonomuraea TaxID=2593643 RepID=UPI00368AF9B4